MIMGAADSGMHDVDLLIVGAGPCGLAAAISAQRAGLRARVLDTGAVVSTITQYPYYVKFFSTADARALSDLPSEARRYLDRIEALVEAPITYVSVGTRRDQIIGL